MRAFFQLALAATAALIGTSVAAPAQIVHPGGVQNIVIDKQDTTNATTVGHNSTGSRPGAPQIKATQQLPFAFVNNYAGGGQVNAYVTGLDPSGALVLLQPDGSFYYPSVAPNTGVPQPINADVAIPLGGQGSTTNIKLPDYISAARVWFAAGNLQFFVVSGANGAPSLVEPSAVNPSDPSAGIDWGFVELTNTEDGGIYANISYVDFVGMVLGMTLTTGSGATQSAPGLQAGAVANICNDLKTQASKDGQPWDQLCLADSSGNPLRVIAPIDYLSNNPNAFSGYYTSYINQVWSQYASEPLIIDTQASPGNVSCSVTSGTLNCAGDNRGYAQPTVSDIFGCNSGPFAIESGDNEVHYAVVPRLCAAFDRTTLLLPGGNVQPALPASDYYTTAPSNFYSAIVHKYEIGGTGYAFSYDDVSPDGQPNQSGVVTDANPQLLTVTVGGPSS